MNLTQAGGVRGLVDGDSLTCPFHSFIFDSLGKDIWRRFSVVSSSFVACLVFCALHRPLASGYSQPLHISLRRRGLYRMVFFNRVLLSEFESCILPLRETNNLNRCR